MITLVEFFRLNQSIIYFVYGLVFFVLGFAIILQTRQSSRLDLARSLRWLAAFGITHAFHEWGDLFMPLQSAYLGPGWMRSLHLLQLVLLALSFMFLFRFGLALLVTGRWRKWLDLGALLLFLIWLVVTLTIIPPIITNEATWSYVSNALARYFIGFPGGLLAAYGLRRHTLQRIKPLNVPQIVLMLQIAGIALGLYALVSGLVPPPVPFFPGSLLNRESFIAFLGMPPLVFRSLTGLIIAVTLIRALEIFDVEAERRIEQLEQNQIIIAERQRLARELHDGAIQKVYTAGLLAESAARLAGSESEIGGRLQKTVAVLHDAIADLRHNLAELHSGSPAQTESLPKLLQELSQDPQYTSMVEIRLEVDGLEGRQLSPIRSDHLVSIVKESLANVVRHAQAQRVEIQAKDLGNQLEIRISDDGIGIPNQPRDGYGLRNMRDRARLLNGQISILRDKGTTVVLTVPWSDL